MPISRANLGAESFKTNQRQNIMAQETRVIELKSIYGLSDIRDTVSETSGGTVTNTVGSGEYALTVAASGDVAILSSAEVGRYVPGFDALAGLGLRLPTLPTGEQYAQWGLYDDNDGFYFGVDATSAYVAVLRNGTEQKFRRSDWVDPLDGTGPSGLTVDFSKGNIYNIQFTWYGYGPAEFRVSLTDGTKNSSHVVVYRYTGDGSTSVRNPNLPVRVQANSGTTAGSFVVYVGGRQYSILGNYEPVFRVTSEQVLSKGSIGETYIPVLSARRKTAYAPSSIKLNGLSLIADVDMVLELILNTTLTGASYASFSGIPATETALERDVTASALTGGQVLWRGLVSGGSGRNSFAYGIDLPVIDLPQSGVFTLAARRVTGTNGTLSATVSFREEW